MPSEQDKRAIGRTEGWECEIEGCDEGSRYGEAPGFIEEDGGKEVCGDCYDEWFENNV